MSQQTVTINGVIYDAQTGLPISRVAPPAPRVSKSSTQHSQSIHQTTQKSSTLNRATVRRIVAQSNAKVRPDMIRPTIQKSPAITKFAPHPTGTVSQKVVADIGPVSHPIGAKAHQRMTEVQQKKQTVHHVAAAPKPSQMIKNEAIKDALTKAPEHNKKTTHIKPARKHTRRVSIATACLALGMFAGYFTYLNMPNLSVRVAAAQAGFSATYPNYQPDGYRVNKIAYTDGEVGIQYAANGGSQAFTVNQERSSWDSSALLANYVQPTTNGSYIPHSEKGITVYVFNNSAAWVNNGIRYTIKGDAPLSSDQILKIATSM